MARKLIMVLAIAALFEPLTTLALAEAAPPPPANQCEHMTIECWQTYDEHGAGLSRPARSEFGAS